MRFDVLTLFPDMFKAVLCNSIIGRAEKAGLIEMNFIDIRDYTQDKHRKVDDTPYSGGGGMLMSPQPVFDAYSSIADKLSYKPYTIFMSPQGSVFNQDKAIELSKYGHIVLLCGHYEGIDQRVIDEIVDAEISLGDFVLTGGEIAAIAVTDAVARLLDGVLSDEVCFTDESHFNGLLEYPQYTRPFEWEGEKVPEVLISGHHENINNWRLEESIKITKKNRPDMLEKKELSKQEANILEKLK
jgi:tRNA (guanine37-N1)-methyltransferase